MKDEILTHLNDPGYLEKMYRTNKASFKEEFNTLYSELNGNTIADFWNERLNYESDTMNRGTKWELLFVIIASPVAGVIAKLPALFPLREAFFYPRNISFIVFPLLTVYFALKNKVSTGKIAFIIGATLASLIFINSLPDVTKSDTLLLSCLHLPLFLWSVLGFAFVGEKKNNEKKRLDFLKYNGDLIVMTTLILIAGTIMITISLELFSVIGFNTTTFMFYFENSMIFGLATVPIVSTYIIRTNPQVVGKISPVIARLFSPLVVLILVIYLIAIISSGKDPYNNREFLLVFNALLIGVMALIFFSITEISKTTKKYTEIRILCLLCVITIMVNAIALSAILFRISEWGITPNRTAILGGNALILINLLLVTAQFFKVLSKKADITEVKKAIAFYLPVYFVWTIIVTFLFPLLFGFK